MENVFTQLLKESGLSREQLAIAMGVQAKTTYTWNDSPPTHVISYLGLHIEYSKLVRLADAIRAIR